MDVNQSVIGGTIRNLRRTTTDNDMVRVTFELVNYRGSNPSTGRYIQNNFVVRGYVSQKQSNYLNIGKKIRVLGKMQEYVKNKVSFWVLYMDNFEFISTQTDRSDVNKETDETHEEAVEF